MNGLRTSILLADAQPLTCAGLASLLQTKTDVVVTGSVAGFDELVAAIGRGDPLDLLIVDLDLPGLDASAGLARLRMLYPSLRIVVIALRLDRTSVLELLSAGVHGCIPKTLGALELSDAFDEILRGRIYVPSLLCEIETPAPEPRHGHGSQPLTERQHEVLTLMAQGQSNKEIARTLRISESTVKVHINAAFRILDVHNRVSAAAALHRLDALSDPTRSRTATDSIRGGSGGLAAAVGIALAIMVTQIEPNWLLLA